MARFYIIAICLAISFSQVIAEVELEIGPDTTVIDGPLKPDGTIDYLAYLNQKLVAKVRPEENFAVDVVRTMPAEFWWSADVGRKTRAWLGLKDEQDDAVLFRSFTDYMAKLGEKREGSKWSDDEIAASENPWAESEYPQVKRWLDEQAAAMDLIAEASGKQQYVMPLIVGDEQQAFLLLVSKRHVAQIAFLTRAFAARAELKINNGDLTGATSDIMVMHRLANLTLQQEDVMSWLYGATIHGRAMKVCDDLLASNKAKPEDIRQLIDDYTSIPRLKDIAPAIDRYERFGAIEYLLFLHEHKEELPEIWEKNHVYIKHDSFDVNYALRQINHYYDRIVEALSIEDTKQRVVATNAIERELDKLYEQTNLMLGGDEQAIDAMRGVIEASNLHTAIGLNLFLADEIRSKCELAGAQLRVQMRLDLQPVVCAIAAYHVEHGEYPPDLQALTPVYLLDLPVDFATGQLPVYRVEDGVAVVYSFGVDMDDDGGTDGGNEDGDIVVRVDRR